MIAGYDRADAGAEPTACSANALMLGPARTGAGCESRVDPATRRRETVALNEAMAEVGVTDGTIVTRDEQELIETPSGSIEVVPVWRFLLDS